MGWNPSELGACKKIWIWDRGPGWRAGGGLAPDTEQGLQRPLPTPTSHAHRSQRLTVGGVPERGCIPGAPAWLAM